MRPGTYNSTFANIGTTPPATDRAFADLDTIVTNAGTAGILDSDPKTLNMFMVRIVPGFPHNSDLTSNGLANIDGNGITAWAGPSLTGSSAFQEIIEGVLAHEIGHNLGLPHIVEAENLMQAGGSSNKGQRLNATQIATAQSSQFAVPTPEPGLAGVLLLASVGTMTRRRRAAA